MENKKLSVDLYTDGGVILHNPSKFGGTYAWVLLVDGIEYKHSSGVYTPQDMMTDTVTNNQMELYAVLNGLAWMRLHVAGQMLDRLYCDSQVTLGRLFKGWRLNGIPQWMTVMMPAALWDVRGVEPVLVKGHAGNKWNEYCDKLCQKEAKRFMSHASRSVAKKIKRERILHGLR